MPATDRARRNPYDHEHRRNREQLIKRALGTQCPGGLVDGEPWYSPNCIGIMTDPAHMHADHGTPVHQGGTRADRVCCDACNTGAGAIAGNRMRNGGDRDADGWHSDAW